MLESLTPILTIGALIVVVALMGLAIAKRYRVAKPNEAFIVTGRKGKTSDDLSGMKVVTGGGVFVWPFVQQLSTLNLSSRRIPVEVRGAPSKKGITLNASGVATVKVGNSEDAIRAAAQRFGAQEGLIQQFIEDQLSGALRAIVGNMTPEEIIADRESFSQQVLQTVTETLSLQGLVLESFPIQDVSDHGSTYIQDMGRASAAEIRRQAEIAEAENRRASEQARIEAERKIADYQRELALRQAEIRAETDRATAQSAAAGPIEQAARQQEILAAQELVAARQAELTERELDTTVRRPADAARYRAEQEAEAARTTTVKQAEAARARALLEAEGELARRTAAADATRLEGAARADATRAEGTAEAAALTARADAYKQFNNAAVLDRLLDVLPSIAKELAAPMGAIDNLTVISTDGAGALPKQVTGNFVQLQQMVKDATGLDVAQLVQQFAGGTTASQPTSSAAAGDVATS